MLFPILVTIFFLSVLILAALIIGAIARPALLRRHSTKIKLFAAGWFSSYAVFIMFFTGPEDLSLYPPRELSPYKLPWTAGVSRLVGQGNRSFTSHGDLYRYAWDFVMPNGTRILAARDGRVIEVEQSFEGIGFNSNYVLLEHEGGERSGYAHIRHNGSLVKVGDSVKQGQPIAFSGMVGQTLFPHVHFAVLSKDGTASIPISFADVPGGIPLAGRFYRSENGMR